MANLGFHYCFTKPPSYLRELLKQDAEICLVHDTKTKLRNEDSVSSVNEAISSYDINESFDTTNLDLTGTPLQVDLHEDTLQSTLIVYRPITWTDDELNHIPLTISQARKFINTYNKEKSSLDAPPSIYCVCDGSDKKQTVILGAMISPAIFMRCQVFILGIFPIGHQNLSVDYMREQHLKNIGVPKTDIQYKVTSSFGIYGYNLRNCRGFVNIEHRGSILMEVSWHECAYDIPKTKAEYQITLQIIIGHVDSKVNALWEEMNFLERCIILSKEDCLETEKLNENGDCFEDLREAVVEILRKDCYTRRTKMQQQQTALNFANLRSANIIDDLWNVLKKAETVFDLRNSFHFIFEFIAQSVSILHVPEDNDSTFASIIRGIYNGKIAVPTLSIQQSIELLTELGLEKLKNDYLCIINHFCSLPTSTLMAAWNKGSAEVPKESRHAQMSLKPEYTRKTRMTFNIGRSGSEILNSGKLEHLARMHAIVEFFLLIQDHSKFSPECYQDIGENACRKYMAPDSPIENFSGLQNNTLCDLTVRMKYIDISVTENKTPVKWHIEMSSKHNHSEVTTVFLHSETPSFPTVIFNNYDLSLTGTDEKLYYVTELVQYKQFLK